VYATAVHGVPRAVIVWLVRSGVLCQRLYVFARIMRRARGTARVKSRSVDALVGRPNLSHQFWANANRMDAPAEITIQPNVDNSPVSQPTGSPVLQP